MTGTREMMNYRKFAASAAKMINKLFDVNEQRVRSEVVKKTEETRSVSLQLTKEEFEKRLTDSIIEFDEKDAGIITFPVFLMCLQVRSLSPPSK
jgi:putative sterol carrier protein